MHRRASSEAEDDEAELLSIRGDLLGLKVSLHLLRLYRLALKAGFDPNQPRFPAKRGRISGRWSGDGSPKTPARQRRLARDPVTLPKTERLRPPGIGHNGPSRTSVPRTPLELPPVVPKERPPLARDRTRIAKALATWILHAAERRALGPLGLVLDLVDLVLWVRDYYPSIQSSFDGPKTLEELRSLADEPRPGYEVHHIVERMPAEQDGFPSSMIEGYDNLVRIPTYQHHQITGWYNMPNERFDGLTPSRYLRGRTWSERVDVGLDALEYVGVLEE